MPTQSDPMTTFSSQVKRSLNVSAYKVLFDDTGDYTYIGNAVPGTLTSATLWQIRRITSADGSVMWADGDIKFDNEWDERTGYGYS